MNASQPRDRRRDLQGRGAWGKQGIAVNLIGDLHCSLYMGTSFDTNIAVLEPHSEDDLAAVAAYCASSEFINEVRALEPTLKANNGVFLKLPFDIDAWRDVGSKKFPGGLSPAHSDDPTQWGFHGHPAFSVSGAELHVALARVAGYRWPAESDTMMRLSSLARERIAKMAALHGTDTDGLLPLHSHGSQQSLADKLRHMLTATFGAPLSPAREQTLVRSADNKLDKREARDATLETWLRDRAFRQHCILFQQRPFLWHLWDGMTEGFSAFLNYHRLDRAALDKLTYTLLGDWLRTAKAEGNTARLERAEQLQQKIAKIIEGESPYDIFVRWKSLAEQPLGWEPDLDDGVRLNIRPFMTAGVLRDQPKGISWNKDRGTDVPSAPWYDLGPRNGGNLGDRINDHHTSLAEKRAARETS
jgi:hypothetical protein